LVKITTAPFDALYELPAQKGAREIHVEHSLPLVPVDEMRRTATRDTGCGHDAVDAAVFGEHALEQRADRVFVAHVALGENNCRRV
jgi:hypothetical protein